MTQLFQCPKCGYRNYVTREDIDARREEIASRLERKSLPWWQRDPRETLKNWWPPLRRGQK